MKNGDFHVGWDLAGAGHGCCRRGGRGDRRVRGRFLLPENEAAISLVDGSRGRRALCDATECGLVACGESLSVAVDASAFGCV